MIPHPAPFLDRLLHALEAAGIDVSKLGPDHVCYRVATAQRYAELKAWLHTQGTLLSEKDVNGRPIAAFRLHTPWMHGDRRIEVLELPSPKPDSPYAEGFEHVEFVVDEDLRAFAQRHPQVDWDLSDLGKPINADVRVRFGAISAKFHRHSLVDVIAWEERTGG